MSRYESIYVFYFQRGGALSGESGFGASWTEDGHRHPRFRISVVHNTGDVYAVNQSSGEVELLGQVAPGKCRGGVRYEDGCAYTLAEAALDGWADEPRDLEWARERLR